MDHCYRLTPTPQSVVSLQDGKGTPGPCTSAPLKSSVCLTVPPHHASCYLLCRCLISVIHWALNVLVIGSSQPLSARILPSFFPVCLYCCVHVRITSWACGDVDWSLRLGSKDLLWRCCMILKYLMNYTCNMHRCIVS